MPKHIINLLVLLGGFLLLALVAKIYLTDPSYYKYGTYRADAVSELAAATPLYRGSAYWLECHPERQADWPTGAHRTVQCEVCHGTAPQCPEDGIQPKPVDIIRLCTTCHLAMPARPARQPQIVLGDHPYPGEETPPCNTCHDPHAPQEWVPGATDADLEPQGVVTADSVERVPGAVSKCAKCHGKQGQGLKRNPALAGLEAAVFIERMNLYISGALESKAMAKFARALSTEEIAELAVYYENLPANLPE